MAATGLLALLDDLTTILDDVAAMSKIAARKTAGIAGDDLAVNAQGLVGIDPSRELPIVGKVALGSVANKVVLIPLALALPKSLITPLLVLGGAFLCYEGVHKVIHRKDAKDEAHHEELIEAIQEGPEALLAVEWQKVRQAMITDVVLSAEIVAVALGAVQDEPFAVKASVITIVSLGMTAGIYGLVAAIVKLDDIGLYLQRTAAVDSGRHRLGGWVVDYTPVLMKGISVVGTAAMFLVGGGILLHAIPDAEPWLHHALESITHSPLLLSIASSAITLAVGFAIGLLVTVVVAGVNKALGRDSAH